jgi:two-component system sensor histidine kinase UhpB
LACGDEGFTMQQILMMRRKKPLTKKIPIKSDEDFRRMFDEAPIGIALTGEGFHFVRSNPVFLKMFGFSEEELSHLTFKEITHPDHLRGDILSINKLIKGSLPVYRTEKRYIKKNMEIIWGNATISAIHNIDHGVDHFLVMVEDITDRKKTELALKESQEQLENFAQHLQMIREEERARVSKELHDDLGQNLSAIRMDASGIIKKLKANKDKEEAKPVIDLAMEMMTVIDEIIPAVRKISSDLRPRVLDELGLVPGIEWLIEELNKRSGIKCRLVTNIPSIDLKLSQSIAVFRIVQEALSNVNHYAGASKILVKISGKKKTFVICIQDNGCGIKESSIKSGKSLGIIEMRERASLIGGHLDIRGIEGQGTQVILTIPKIT